MSRINAVATTTILNQPIVTTAETIIATTPPLILPFDSAPVFLFGTCSYVSPAGATSATLRIRRGAALTSALVNVSLIVIIGAAQNLVEGFSYADLAAGASGAVQYSFTIQIAAAAANTTILDVSLAAFAL